MDSILSIFLPISLEEMNNIRLMNRMDTKFITTCDKLKLLLVLAQREYYIQDINGERNMPYYTLYYDTPHRDMFLAHQNGKKTRQKVRIRSYLYSGTSFLEVKNKNNHGRTEKQRIHISSRDITVNESRGFLDRYLNYTPDSLLKQLENQFNRITLVNKSKTERLTIDTSLQYYNIQTKRSCTLNNLVIIELKRDGNYPSPISNLLKQLHIYPCGFSKYCIGMAITDKGLKQNRFKEKLRMLKHLKIN